jgi:hypothetical protein
MIPSFAAECTSNKDIEASRLRWELLRDQPVKAAEKENTCRTYAALFYESVTLRQAAASCAVGERNLAVLDSEINAFNELLATKCSD